MLVAFAYFEFAIPSDVVNNTFWHRHAVYCVSVVMLSVSVVARLVVVLVAGVLGIVHRLVVHMTG